MHAALEKLALADPELADRIRLDPVLRRLSPEALDLLVEESIQALAQELGLGRALGAGFLRLGTADDVERMTHYAELVRGFLEQGPTLARIAAERLPPVLKTGSGELLALFLEAMAVAAGQGTHTLNDYLKPVDRLLDAGDTDAARAYLQLLVDVLPQSLSYHQNLNLSQVVPATCLAMARRKRARQIRELSRVLAAEVRWGEAFIRGLEKGLRLLEPEDLALFVRTGLEKCAGAVDRGRRYFALSTQTGKALFDRLLTVVFLFQIGRQLNRYLAARTGEAITVRPLSTLPSALQGGGRGAVSDARHVYLPDELRLATREENLRRYKALASLEAACHEFGTFTFDLERALERCGEAVDGDAGDEEGSELARFLRRFDDARLAADLFTIFEHGRLRRCLAEAYPGLIEKTFPLFQRAARRDARGGKAADPLDWLYRRLALGMQEPLPRQWDRRTADALRRVAADFDAHVTQHDPVEASAEQVHRAYPLVAAVYAGGETRRPLEMPLGRRLAPELVGAVDGVWERRAAALQRRLAKKDLPVYRADLRRALARANGVLTPEELAELIRRRRPDAEPDRVVLMRLLDDAGVAARVPEVQGRISWYPEWDVRSGDYLLHHARVAEHEAGGGDPAFYEDVLTRHAGLLGHLRRSFELLRPEGLRLLRRWREGDDFDYRALLEYAVDRRMGVMPSRRIYIKRIKRQRDVAVLLLVDLSRSTANALPDGHASVLDVEKEALVLFCEALQKSGDRFAVVTFCSMTRFAVEYMRVKDFDAPVDTGVMGRIAALEARGRTRMGAAVRHATERLGAVAARVRLLVVLSDGFPNDSDYKGDYAIADTARAVSEARLAGIHVHGITVNLSDAARLDEIYGRGRHSLISDVRELPRKLPGIYRHLTR